MLQHVFNLHLVIRQIFFTSAFSCERQLSAGSCPAKSSPFIRSRRARFSSLAPDISRTGRNSGCFFVQPDTRVGDLALRTGAGHFSHARVTVPLLPPGSCTAHT